MKKPMSSLYFVVVIFSIAMFSFSGCEKENNDTPNVPKMPLLTTSAITGIGTGGAVTGGNITSQGSAAVTVRGVCWGEAVNPDLTGTYTTDGAGTGVFTSTLSGLKANTTYYVRAYATNQAGTAYGNQLSFKTLPSVSGPVTDIDGNSYPTIMIGNQVWMAKNLAVTKLNDGTPISLVENDSAWGQLTTPAFCWYNNDKDSLGAIYGALYTWYAVETGKLCPSGWHVPTDAEWIELTDFLGGNTPAGGKLKEAGTSHWTSTNSQATNETGFTAIPGGFREIYGLFSYLGTYAGWWSATDTYTYVPWARYMVVNPHTLNKFGYIKHTGMSVRCLKD